MESNFSKATKPPVSNVVAGLYTECESVRDSITDLNEAGFGEREVSVVFSAEAKQTEQSSREWERSAPQAMRKAMHGMQWKIRRGMREDKHHHGPELIAGGFPQLDGELQQEYSEVDLKETLLGMGVSEDRVWLLNREIGIEGVLLLVDAGDRTDEVERILLRDCGIIRTASVTERQRSAA